MRDWLSTLWPASYKGVPFYVEHDGERGGRRLAVHQFPRRDDPFLEDLGRSAKSFEITAYLVGDASDSDASALSSVFDAEGAGLLVLPTHGPIMVRNGPFERSRSKDRLGYIAFTGTFFREGAASSLASVDYLAQLVFDAVDALALAAQGPVAALDIVGAPEWVVAAGVAGVQDIVATLEVMRDARGVDPALAPALALSLSSVYAVIPTSLTRLAVDPTFVADLFSVSRDLAAAMDPSVAAGSFTSNIDAFPVSVAAAGVSVNSARAAANSIVVNQLGRLALIAGLIDSLMRQTFGDRQAATAARSSAFGLLEAELEVASSLRASDLFSAIGDMRAALARYFATTIADLRPVVVVTAPRMLPAVWHAWRLYADPTRAQELIDRNRAPHPAFLSERFEALAP